MSVKGSIQRKQKSGKGMGEWRRTAEEDEDREKYGRIAWEATCITLSAQVRQWEVRPADGLVSLI